MRGYNISSLPKGNTLEDRIQLTLQKIKKEVGSNKIVKIDFYLGFCSKDEYQTLRNEVHTLLANEFGNKIPASTVLTNNALSESGQIILCEFINDSSIQVDYKKVLNHPYVTLTHKNGTELISGGIFYNEESVLMSSQRSIDFVEQLLMAEDMDYGHIFKQNNFISEAGEKCAFDGSRQSNSDSFNEIENLFCDPQLYISGKPLTTSINCNFGGITVDFIAFSSHHPDTISISKNTTAQAKYINFNSPEMYFSNVTSCQNDDIEKETLSALTEIFSLIEKQNIDKYDIEALNNQNLKEGFSLIKAHVKSKENLSTVNDILKNVLTNTKIIVLQSENLKPNSNIELEGVISTKTL